MGQPRRWRLWGSRVDGLRLSVSCGQPLDGARLSGSLNWRQARALAQRSCRAAELPEPEPLARLRYIYGVADDSRDASSARQGLAAPDLCRAARRSVALQRARDSTPPLRAAAKEALYAPFCGQAAPTPYSLPISYPRVRTIRSGSAAEPPSEK